MRFAMALSRPGAGYVVEKADAGGETHVARVAAQRCSFAVVEQGRELLLGCRHGPLRRYRTKPRGRRIPP